MAEKRFNRSNAIAVTCAGILVGTEIIAAALAFGWAMSGLMGWGSEVTLALVVLCLLGGVYLTAQFIKGAIAVEPFYE